PSAGYIGRGVALQSAEEYMLYHQNILAQVKSGSRRLPASQIFSPAIRRFDWRHSQTSARSRKYQPLATAPWPLGINPVSRVDWTVQVTAGVTVASGRMAPRAARRRRFGVCSPTSAGVSPTTRTTRVGCMSDAAAGSACQGTRAMKARGSLLNHGGLGKGVSRPSPAVGAR